MAKDKVAILGVEDIVTDSIRHYSIPNMDYPRLKKYEQLITVHAVNWFVKLKGMGIPGYDGEGTILNLDWTYGKNEKKPVAILADFYTHFVCIGATMLGEYPIYMSNGHKQKMDMWMDLQYLAPGGKDKNLGEAISRIQGRRQQTNTKESFKLLKDKLPTYTQVIDYLGSHPFVVQKWGKPISCEEHVYKERQYDILRKARNEKFRPSSYDPRNEGTEQRISGH